MPVYSTLREVVARENLRRAEARQPALTQQQIAQATGLPPSVVNGLMTNRVQRADFGTLAKLCRFFRVKPGELLD
jgi:DNA-binding Xre family transcriptional regulator